jgi:AraC-like DNA-binding protein
MEHLKVILLVTSFIIPFILAFQIIFTKDKNISKIIMAMALLNAGLIFLFDYFYFLSDYSLYYPFHSIHSGLELCIYPSIYLYIKSIVAEESRLRKDLWHLFPGALVFILASLIFYVFVGKNDTIFFLKNNKLGYPFVGLKFQVLIISRYIALGSIALQAIYYSVAFLKIPKHYNERLNSEFSNIENFSIDWINKFNLSFGICGLISFLVYTFIPITGSRELLIVFVFFIFSVFLCAMGVVSLKQQKPLIDFDEIKGFELNMNVKSKVKDDRLITELNNYIENQHAYLQPDISLTNVSRILGTNRTYLSSIINQQFGMNFNTYINYYRIKYVNDYLKDNPKTSKEELVQLAGFGSKSTMHRAMNKMKGHNNNPEYTDF